MAPEQIQTLDDLRRYVHRELCAKENLLEDQFALQETPLQIQKKNCGIQFVLWGPRNLRLGAIWSREHNILYLYDSRGERYQKVHLARWLTTPESSASAAAG